MRTRVLQMDASIVFETKRNGECVQLHENEARSLTMRRVRRAWFIERLLP